MDLENGVFRKHLSPISKRSGSSITWKHEPDLERLPLESCCHQSQKEVAVLLPGNMKGYL